MKNTDKIYGIYYPRNFANEYTVYSVAPERRKAWEEFCEKVKNDPNRDAHRISRKEAEQRTSAQTKKEYVAANNCASIAGIVEF